MTTPWNDVASSPEFKALPDAEKEAARQQYFKEVVEPQVPVEKRAEVRQAFDADTRFSTTQGGAAVGNPNLQRQGDRQLRPGTISGADAIKQIGGAGAIGAVAGAFAPEILQGAGALATRFAPPLAPVLNNMGMVLRGQRGASAVSGGISGAVGETAGQAAETMGAGPITAEAARFVGGSISPEMAKALPLLIRKVAGMPYIADGVAYIKSQIGKDPNLTAEQEKYIRDQIDLLRGGPKSPTETTQRLETIGDAMGTEGQRLEREGATVLSIAERNLSGVQPIGTGKPRELADLGTELRDRVVTRNQAAIDARRTEYKRLEDLRDQLVSMRESKGQFISNLPEYQQIISGLKAELQPGKRSPEVQGSIRHIIAQLENAEKDVFGQMKPVSFQAIDDVRRKLGEVFKGAPAEGYSAMNDARGRALYAQLSALQKRFAGGETGPQAALLDKYHLDSEALSIFRSKSGRKVTALDKFDPEQFATDASTLPSTYFKTRQSIRTLRELTGDDATVNRAAIEYAERQLADMDATKARKFLRDNTEWISEVPTLRVRLENYTNRLAAAERSLRNAQDFVKEAVSANGALTKGFPAQRAIDLIQGGTPELWAKAGPAIAASPTAKQQVAKAVAQLMAERAEKSSSDLVNFFARKVRPGVEQSGLASKAELDYILERLVNIETRNMPEPEKLGAIRRIIMQGATGWASSAVARGGNQAAQWNRDKAVPE